MKHIFIVILLVLSVSAFSQKKIVLSGVVTDSKTGKALENIDILVKDNLTGTLSAKSGEYQLYLKEGKYQLVVSGEGYKEKTVQVSLSDSTHVKVELEPEKKEFKKKQAGKPSLYPTIKNQENSLANIHS